MLGRKEGRTPLGESPGYKAEGSKQKYYNILRLYTHIYAHSFLTKPSSAAFHIASSSAALFQSPLAKFDKTIRPSRDRSPTTTADSSTWFP